MKFYTPKYVETKGIIEFEGEIQEVRGARKRYVHATDRKGVFLAENVGAFTRRDVAVAAAVKALRKTAASLDARKARITDLIADLEKK
jgi:hypothetical protein